MPKTRSGLFYGRFDYQFYYPDKSVYQVDIDFDEAHNQWIKNKIYIGNGCYNYIR